MADLSNDGAHSLTSYWHEFLRLGSRSKMTIRCTWNSNTWRGGFGFLFETPELSNQIAWWILIESTRIWRQLLASSGRKSNKILPHYICLRGGSSRAIGMKTGDYTREDSLRLNFIKVWAVLEADELLEGLSYKFCVMFTGVLPCLQHQIQCLFRCWDS